MQRHVANYRGYKIEAERDSGDAALPAIEGDGDE